MGVLLPPPGRSSGGLSKYLLGRLRVLVPLPSHGHHTTAATTHPSLSRSDGGRPSLEPLRAVVSTHVSAGSIPSPPAHDPVPEDRRAPPHVGPLCFFEPDPECLTLSNYAVKHFTYSASKVSDIQPE